MGQTMKLVQRVVNVALAISILGVCVDSPQVQARGRAHSSAISPELLMFLEAAQSSTPVAPAPAGQPTKSDDESLPEGKGRDVTLRLCSNCHTIARWDKQRHSSDQWSDIVDDMVGRGMDASDEDLATANSYLSKYLAPAPKTPAPPPPPDNPPQ
jgi:hypothetical protein